MFKTIINAFKVADIRKKIFLTIFLLFVYRIGCWLPIPGVNVAMYSEEFKQRGDTLLGLLSAISGGALANGSFLALGISPYINASIIVQLLTVAIPKFEQWSKQGEEGKKKLSQVTRIGTLILATAQSIGIVISWSRGGANASSFLMPEIFLPAGSGANLTWLIGIFVVIILVAGSSFTMWIGEKITELGIGNGISLLIFIGILATAGFSIISAFQGVFAFGPQSAMRAWELGGFLVLVLLIFTFIVLFDLAERRVHIQYAKQVKGRKMYGGQSTHIPIKINAAGVLPIIFATALVSFPQLLAQMFFPTSGFYAGYVRLLGAGQPIYIVLTALLIFGFSFFYAQIQFNPTDVARNIQQYGGFIPGIRPGEQTAAYLKKISKRLTLFGALFLAFIALVPSMIFSLVINEPGLVNAFSATGLLIVVSVALEFDKQLQGQLMMKHYKGFLK
jgi:preprotein translocase subunit SecY